jgi:hypothetical protein
MVFSTLAVTVQAQGTMQQSQAVARIFGGSRRGTAGT